MRRLEALRGSFRRQAELLSAQIVVRPFPEPAPLGRGVDGCRRVRFESEFEQPLHRQIFGRHVGQLRQHAVFAQGDIADAQFDGDRRRGRGASAQPAEGQAQCVKQVRRR